MSGGSLSRDAIAAVDPQDMLGDVLAQPHQVGDALWRVESAGIPAGRRDGGLLVCGMGGSAIGGDLAAAAIGERAARELRVVRDYGLEPWTAPGPLALCASYSGDTEETIAAYDDAAERGLERVVLTTGGTLAERARADGAPVIGVPAGMQPRAAVVYMTVAALECASLCGAAPPLRDECERASELLVRLVEEWGPDADDSLAKRIARDLHGGVPVVYGAGPTVAVARRWKAQLNENANLPAFAGELPEGDHNEICGWDRAAGLAPLRAVFLDSPDVREPTRRRIGLTRATIGADPALELEAVGDTPVARVLAQVLLGDLVSVYLAALDAVDPTPVEPIERFKRELAGSA